MEFARHGQPPEQVIENTLKVLEPKLVKPGVEIKHLNVRVKYDDKYMYIDIPDPIRREHADLKQTFFMFAGIAPPDMSIFDGCHENASSSKGPSKSVLNTANEVDETAMISKIVSHKDGFEKFKQGITNLSIPNTRYSKYYNLCVKIHTGSNNLPIGMMKNYINFVIKSLEPDTLKLLINEILEAYNQEHFSTSQSINILFQHRLEWIRTELSSCTTNTDWSMPKASLPEHPSVEAFLKSSDETFEYKGFSTIAAARKFAETYQKEKDAYSVKMEANGKGNKSYVLITKTRDCLPNRKAILEEEEQAIQKKIKQYEIVLQQM